MKVLLDEDVPEPLVELLPTHQVETVSSMGWLSVKNGMLLKLIEGQRFDAFVTGDKNMQHQKTLASRPFAVLILSTIHWPTLKANVAPIAEAIDQAQAGKVCTVDCGSFRPKRNPFNPSV